ncbi:MAG: hypothetical protein ACT4NL_02400 [Pseudomarimonas sp.]
MNLLLEPVGGSDAEMTPTGRRVIEQYKTHRDEPWSTRDVIDAAVADFVRASLVGRTAHDEFRFVTDGRVDHLQGFVDFLARVMACEASGTPLDAMVRRPYRGLGSLTDDALFAVIQGQIAIKLKSATPLALDLVMHVLARTKLEGGVREESMRANVERFLRRCLPNPHDAPEKTLSLVGRLVDALATGPIRCNAREFLHAAGIDTDRPARLATLQQRLRQAFLRTTTLGMHRYRPSHDVRSEPPWNVTDTPILALAAPPGTGKSWQLIRLGRALAERGFSCAYAPLQGDVARALEFAAQSVWNAVLQSPTTSTLASLKHALIAANEPITAGPWLVVLIDGPIDVAGVERLIDLAAVDPDLRFAITVSDQVGERLRSRRASSVEVIDVHPFTHDELITHLELHGVSWADLPQDLFNLLTLPLLASLYVRASPGTFTLAPQSEYALFDALWNRIAERPGGTGASAHLRTLARAFAEQPDAEFLGRERALSGASDEALRALADAGWLDIDSRSRLRFAHDRLLNWALADAVVSDIEEGLLLAEDALPALQLPWSPPTRWGYVFMDVLWKLCDTPRGRASAARILRASPSNKSDIPDHVLYEQLLPTLGWRGIDLLDALLTIDADAAQSPRLVQWAKLVARQHLTAADIPALEQRVKEWLGRSDLTAVRLALTLVEAAGLSTLADEVFHVHLDHVDALRNRDKSTSDYEVSFAALKECVRRSPAWLERAIEAANDAHTLGALAWQLLNLEDDAAEQIWARRKARLVEHAAPDFLRGTLACIRRFRDVSLIEFVRSALGSDKDFDAATAIGVLAAIAPEMALAVLESQERAEFRFTRDIRFAVLHRQIPAAAEQWLLRHFDEGTNYELYEAIEPEASPALAEHLMASFARAVEARQHSDNPWLHRWQRLLTKLRQQHLVHALASTPTETGVLSIATRRVNPDREWHDHLLGEAREILIAIGGNGLSSLLRFELEHVRGRVAVDALHLATLSPWPSVEADLLAHVDFANQVPGDAADISTRLAIVALATLDYHDALIQLVRSAGTGALRAEDFDTRRGASPFPSEKVDIIAANLTRTDGSQLELLRELALAAHSQSPTLIGPIEQAMRSRPDDSAVFGFCVEAVLTLGAVPESAALWGQRWLANEATRERALRLLVRCGSPECWQILLDFGRTVLARHPWTAAAIAVRHPEEGALAGAASQLVLDVFHHTEMATDVFGAVARLGSVADRSKLRQLVFRSDPVFLDVRRAAIRAWLEVDGVEAVDAALWALEHNSSHDAFCAAVIMRHGTHEQCLRLMEMLPSLDRETLWYHAARAVRRRPSELADALIAHLQASTASMNRRLFAVLAGWQGERHRTELQARMRIEHSPSVLKALEKALTRIGQLQTLSEHLQALRTATGAHRLSALQACLAMGQPFILRDSDDALYIGTALATHPRVFHCQAFDTLDSLCKAWKPES